MQITFLGASVPLTKSFTATTKSSYPSAYEFTSHTHDVTSLQDFLTYLNTHAADGHCLLKGVIQHELVSQSRAGSTEATTDTEWVCFDFDGASNMGLVTNFLYAIGNPDHILQYSASHGVTGQPQTTKLHIFALLSRPTSPIMLKLWLQQMNMEQLLLRDEATLTKTGNALSYVLDPTVAQNDKLIYISPPDCTPPSLDTLTASQQPRIQLVPGTTRVLDIDTAFSKLLSKDKIRALIEGRINELRTANNLGPRKTFNFKIDATSGTEYLDKPDAVAITGHKTDRGFVYLNINGGDSWGYYYPETDNTFVFNFKDEPVYKLQQLDPSFYKSSLPAARAAADAQLRATKLATYTAPPNIPTTTAPPTANAPTAQRIYLAFRDRKTALYYNAIFNVTTNRWESIDKAASEKQLTDFMLQYGQPESEIVPIWDLVFDPSAPPIDISSRTVNLYDCPDLIHTARNRLKNTPQSVPATIPPTIHKIIWSVVGGDQPTYDHFINWIRFVVQERRRSQTAWLFNGVQGTGKGLLAHRILRPLVGLTNSSFFDASILEDKFTDSLETSLLTFIDELTIKDLEDSSKIMSSLKSRITEPTVVIRKMRTSPYEAPNYNNYICFSNSHEQLVIEASDRRYNVGVYQPKKLAITDNEVNVQLPAEIEDFAVWLLATPADEIKARNIVHNQARSDMQEVSLNSIDTIAKMLLEGNLEELYDMRVNQSQVSGSLMETSFRYNSLIDDIIFHDLHNLQREQVILFFQHGAGVDAVSPIKVTKFLAHHGIKIKPVKINGQAVKGFQVDWKYDQQWYDDRKAELVAKRTPKKSADEA